ncbi:MAG: tetratricopeptide repeat protein [Alphaproteobacteria bacterium]
MPKIFSALKALAVIALFLIASGATDTVVENLDTSGSDYLTAIYARQVGDVGRATDNYMRVLDKDPENLKVLEEAFTYFVYIGDFDRALKLARRLQALDREHSSSAMLLSLRAFRRGKSKEMEGYLTRARGLGFDLLAGPLMRAWLLAEDKKIEKALNAMAGLKDNPGFEPFYAEHSAFMLDHAGKFEEAEVAYLALLARPEITSLQPLFAYGAFLQRRGRGSEAAELYREFQPSSPTNLQLGEALARFEAGKKPVSIVDDPNKALAMALLRTGVQLTREQAFFPGVIYARFALYLDRDFDEGLLFLGNMLSTEPHPGLALEAYSRVDPKGPFWETALLRRAMVLSFHDRRDEGINLIEAYLEEKGESYDALVALGDLYRSGEDYAEALPFYEQAFSLKATVTEEDWFLLFTRGISYERLDMWEKAEADFLKALEFQPDEPDILNYLGYSWIDRGMNLEAGRKMIEKAVAQRPDNGFILDSLGWAQYLMGEYEEAVENLERAVTLEPGDPTLNDHLGDAYWRVGREREARFQWDHALKLEPEKDVLEKLNNKLISGLNTDPDPKDHL